MSDSTKPRKPKLTQAEKTAISDRKMLDAAVELIIERGAEKTTLREIGLRAGYSRGLANYRFGNKDELFRTMLGNHRAVWMAELEAQTRDKQGFDAILARVDAIEAVIHLDTRQVKAMYKLWFYSVGQPSDFIVSELQVYNFEAYRAIRKAILQGIGSGELAADIDIKTFTINFYSLIFGFIYQWLIAPDECDTKPIFASIRQFCYSCLQPSR